jgi:hypothetical protein
VHREVDPLDLASTTKPLCRGMGGAACPGPGRSSIR